MVRRRGGHVPARRNHRVRRGHRLGNLGSLGFHRARRGQQGDGGKRHQIFHRVPPLLGREDNGKGLARLLASAAVLRAQQGRIVAPAGQE